MVHRCACQSFFVWANCGLLDAIAGGCVAWNLTHRQKKTAENAPYGYRMRSNRSPFSFMHSHATL